MRWNKFGIGGSIKPFYLRLLVNHYRIMWHPMLMFILGPRYHDLFLCVSMAFTTLTVVFLGFSPFHGHYRVDASLLTETNIQCKIGIIAFKIY